MVALTPRSKRNMLVAAFGILAIAATAFFYFVDPSTSRIAPKCMWKMLTGFDCPGCGFSRASHALLHGRIAEAWHYNLFFVVSIPYLLAVVVGSFMRPQSGWRRFWYSRAVAISYIILFFAWWILRNILEI